MDLRRNVADGLSRVRWKARCGRAATNRVTPIMTRMMRIARSLGITEWTVAFHVASLCATLEAANHAQAVALTAHLNLL